MATPSVAADRRIDAATVVPLLVAAVYLAIEIFFFSTHEPWHDEAQAWLKAKDMASPLHFLVIPGEGHPPAWYWLLRLISYILTFDQARALMIGVVAVNAWLLTRLLGDRPVLLAMLFLSLPLLHTWGFHFRPYPLVLTCVVGALLADRGGKPLLATWILALSCSLSFFGGWLLAFWLVVQLQRRTPIVQLVAPAIVAALFGLSAILSSTGNVDLGNTKASVLTGFFDVMALAFAIPETNSVIIVVVAAVILSLGLRRTPLILATVLVLWVLLGLFGAFFYGLREWHTAFALMVVLMAFQLTRAPIWPLLLLLFAQDYWGFKKSAQEFGWPSAVDSLAYAAVQNDAGDRLDPEHNLVAWPDHVLTPSAARHGFRYISGNTGAVISSVDLRSREHGDMSRKVFAEGPSPYWLVCFQCESPLVLVRDAGRTATQIMPKTESTSGSLAAYRID